MLIKDCVEHNDCIGDHVDEHEQDDGGRDDDHEDDADDRDDEQADMLAEDDHQGLGALPSSIRSNAIVDASHCARERIVHNIIYWV